MVKLSKQGMLTRSGQAGEKAGLAGAKFWLGEFLFAPAPSSLAAAMRRCYSASPTAFFLSGLPRTTARRQRPSSWVWTMWPLGMNP